MSALGTRLAKLEEKIGLGSQPARMIVVKGGNRPRAGEVEAFLAGQGIVTTPADQIVHLLTFYEVKNGGEEKAGPLELLSLTVLGKQPWAI